MDATRTAKLGAEEVYQSSAERNKHVPKNCNTKEEGIIFKFLNGLQLRSTDEWMG